MKQLILATIFLVLGIGLFGVADVPAQPTPKRLSALPAKFQTFYTNFRNAVIRRDKQAVAAMTKFPFGYGWDAGDEGTYSRRQFLAKFDSIFPRSKRLFRQKNPRAFYGDGNSFDLTDESDASHYGFERTATGYKLTSFIVEP